MNLKIARGERADDWSTGLGLTSGQSHVISFVLAGEKIVQMFVFALRSQETVSIFETENESGKGEVEVGEEWRTWKGPCSGDCGWATHQVAWRGRGHLPVREVM